MELNGALSNPRVALEGWLESLAGLHGELRRLAAAERARPRLRPRAMRVQAAVEAIVEEAGRPMRVRDICAELAKCRAGAFDKASVRKTLNNGSHGEKPRFRRIGWGLYEHAS